MRSIPRLKDCIFLESCKCLFKLFSSKNILPQKKVAKLPHRREVQHTCIYICPWGFVISSFCKVTNLLSAQFQLFASNCATKKDFLFCLFLWRLLCWLLERHGLIRDLTIFHGLKSNEKDRLRGICVGLRNTRNFTAAVLFGNETSFWVKMTKVEVVVFFVRRRVCQCHFLVEKLFSLFLLVSHEYK